VSSGPVASEGRSMGAKVIVIRVRGGVKGVDRRKDVTALGRERGGKVCPEGGGERGVGENDRRGKNGGRMKIKPKP